MNWKKLAPQLVRQRVVIEAITQDLVGEESIKAYLVNLSTVLDMHPLQEPYAYPAMDAGYGGWIHWITSGCHVYSYSAEWTKIGKPMITVDAYTCKSFSIEKAVAFTKEFFNTDVIVWKDIDT